jgi:hypothetical protein
VLENQNPPERNNMVYTENFTKQRLCLFNTNRTIIMHRQHINYSKKGIIVKNSTRAFFYFYK